MYELTWNIKETDRRINSGNYTSKQIHILEGFKRELERELLLR